MDSPFLGTREELYHVQLDIKHVQAVQINHSDRLLRLEKRQADDAALKSVWGTGSPFPGILSGTPQTGPVANPSNDVFDDFDDEEGHNLLGNLQLEADGEPVRRGASRANSVRFDVSALQGSNWAQGSRSSGEFGPVRPGSGFGSLPMTERSLSHKSDGRHSSAGHSVHSMHSVASGRTSSLGLDTNFAIGGGGQHEDSRLDIPDPPPGLFILGPVPAIIRCWLTTNFSHNALLYAVVCTGSQRSVLDYALVKELRLGDQMQKNSTGGLSIRLPVYLPEAIVTQPTSRSNSPAPQLPTLTADFEIVGITQHTNTDHKKGIRVFLGSDTLRSHNADILFSQNLMTLYGDDRNKLSVPFVRPEDESLFKNLCTSNIPQEKMNMRATVIPVSNTKRRTTADATTDLVAQSLPADLENPDMAKSSGVGERPILAADPESLLTPVSTSDLNNRKQASGVVNENAVENTTLIDSEKPHGANGTATELEISDTAASSDSTRRGSLGGIWGSWRHSNTSMNGSENGHENESTSGYQRPTRSRRSMKVLKSSKSTAAAPAPRRSSSPPARTRAAYEPAPRISGESRQKSQVIGVENVPLHLESKKVGSEESESESKGLGSVLSIPRSSNPIGSATAFAWMNPSKPKASFTTAE